MGEETEFKDRWPTKASTKTQQRVESSKRGQRVIGYLGIAAANEDKIREVLRPEICRCSSASGRRWRSWRQRAEQVREGCGIDVEHRLLCHHVGLILSARDCQEIHFRPQSATELHNRPGEDIDISFNQALLLVLMLSQSLRASRLGAVRLARQHASSARRTFVSSSTRQADLVQDVYLNQLKAYKIPQPKAGDEKGQVHEFKAPAAPQSPEEGDLANDLKAYESQEVEVEGQGADASSSGSETNFFEDEDFGEEEEEEKAH